MLNRHLPPPSLRRAANFCFRPLKPRRETRNLILAPQPRLSKPDLQSPIVAETKESRSTILWIGKYSASGTLLKRFDYGADLARGELAGEGERFYFSDGQGSVTALSAIAPSGGGGGQSPTRRRSACGCQRRRCRSRSCGDPGGSRRAVVRCSRRIGSGSGTRVHA